MKQKKKYVPAHSLIYIVNGEAAIFNEELDKIVLRLKRGQFIGESQFTKKVSNRYTGNVFAGLNPLSVYAFSYFEMERYLTFPEKAML